MQGFGEAKFRKKSTRLSDLVPVLEWPEGDYENIRLIGPISAYCHIWFTIRTKMKPKQAIPKLCLDLDPETDEFTTEICPYRKSGKGREGKFYVVNCIVRSLQEDSKGNVMKFPKPTLPVTVQHGYKAYWGTKADTKNTPVRIVEMTENAAEKLVNLKKLNRVKGPDGNVYYEVGDPKFGCDIQIMLDPNKKGAARVDIQKGDRTPISDEERRYILFPTDLLKPERLEEARREMASLSERIVEEDKKSDDDSSSGSGRSAKRRNPDPDEDDMADISEDELDADIDMEERPRGKAGKTRREEPEDDLDADMEGEDFDADIDMEERPRGKPAGRTRREEPEDDLDADLDGDLDGELDGELEDEEPEDEPERPVRRNTREVARVAKRDVRPASREERRPVSRTAAPAARRR